MAGNLLNQLANDPDFQQLSASEQDSLYEELSGSRAARGLTGPTQISVRPRLSISDVFPSTHAAIQTRQKLPAVYGASAAVDFLRLLGLPMNLGADIGMRTGSRPQQPLGATIRTALHGGEQELNQGQVPEEGLLGERSPSGAIKTLPTMLLGIRAPVIQRAGQEVAEAIESAQIPAPLKNLPNPIEFLRGNSKQIQQSTKIAHEFVKSLRPEGSRHELVTKGFDQLAEAAWQPVKQYAAQITHEIPYSNLIQHAETLYGKDPERLAEVKQVLEVLGNNQKHFVAPELVNLSSQAGSHVPKGVMQGIARARLPQKPFLDARTVIADVLEAAAPDPVKGFFQQGKRNWANFVTDAERFSSIFKHRSAANKDTQQGINFLTRLGSNQLTQSEQEFIQRMQAAMPELFQQLLPISQQLAKASGVRKAGQIIAPAVLKGAAGATGVGGATGLGYLLYKLFKHS